MKRLLAFLLVLCAGVVMMAPPAAADMVIPDDFGTLAEPLTDYLAAKYSGTKVDNGDGSFNITATTTILTDVDEIDFTDRWAVAQNLPARLGNLTALQAADVQQLWVTFSAVERLNLTGLPGAAGAVTPAAGDGADTMTDWVWQNISIAATNPALTNLTAIRNLDLSGSSAITGITFAANGNNTLRTINLSNCVALTGNLTLAGANGAQTALRSLNLTNCRALTGLIAANAAPSVCTNLENLTLTGCTGLQTITLATGTVGCTNLETLDVSGCSALTTLNIGGGAATTGACTGLTTVNADGCAALITVNASHCTSLTEMNLRGTAIGTLYAVGCTSLETVKASHGTGDFATAAPSFAGSPNLKELDLSNCTALLHGGLSDFVLTGVKGPLTLNLTGCTGLTGEVTFAANAPAALTELTVISDRLPQFTTGAATALASMDVSQCTAMTNLNVAGCSALDTLTTPASLTMSLTLRKTCKHL